jgi:hypothetical protein
MEAEELKFYLKHWGIHVTDETFNKIFETLDWDKDGKVSYTDFQKTVGREIHPGEDLYFRQDNSSMLTMTACKHPKCWQPTKQGKNYCSLHIRVNMDLANAFFIRIYRGLSHRWLAFIKEVKAQAETQDQAEIKLDVLFSLLNKFKFHPPPTDQEKEQILDSYPGNDEGQRILVNVGTLFNIGHLIAI